MLFAGINLEDIEPVVVSYVTKGETEGIWEEDGWGFYDVIGLIADNEAVFGDPENNMIQTDIPSTHPNFDGILELLLKHADVVFDKNGKEIEKSDFSEHVDQLESCFVAIGECSPD